MKKHIITTFLPLVMLWVMLSSARGAVRHFTIADGLPTNQVRQVLQLPNRQILVATDGMFSLYNGHDFLPLPCDLDSVRLLPIFGGHDALWQGDSLLWLKDFYYLYLYDTRQHRFRYDYNRYIQNPAVKHFITCSEKKVTRRITQQLQPYQHICDSVLRSQGLQGFSLTSYLLDHQGGQWFGLRDGGICYLPPSTSLVHLTTLGNDIALRMIEIDEQRMLVGGMQGLYEYDCQQQCVVRTLASGDIFTYEMSRDHRGCIWAATSQGVYAYNHGQMQHYDMNNTTGFIDNSMRFALPIDNRRLLVCNFMHQLGYLYPEEHRFQSLNARLPQLNNYRTMIVASPLGNRNHVAVCTQNGLFVLDITTDRLLPSRLIAEAGKQSRKYNCILHDRTGRTWIGTQNGLLLISRNSVLTRLTRTEGLSNNCIESLTEDLQGNIWAATSSGLNRIRTSPSGELGIRPLTVDDGLPAVEFTERGICLMPDGTLHLATPAGMVSLPVAPFQPPAQPDTLVLVSLQVANVPQPLDSMPLYLTHCQNYLEAKVSPLNYAHPHQPVYRSRLLGLEEQWHLNSTDAGMYTIRYNALSPGSYTLQVQCSLGDGIWGPVLSKQFHIAPPLWLTWWAKMAYLLLAGALIMGLISLYVRYRRRKLERENEERVNRLFALREEASRQFAHSLDATFATTDGQEDALVRRVMEAIGQNIGNSDYTVEMLARDVGMSRANLYKKMQSQLGITPNDFMRNARLKHAARLLAETQIPVSQLSLMVGFQTPRYFSQCFRQMFGVTPSEYRGKNL